MWLQIAVPWQSTHACFDLQLAIESQGIFVSPSPCSAAAANVMLPLFAKSKMLEKSGFLLFIRAYKNWKHSLKHNFVLYLRATTQSIRYNYSARQARTLLQEQFRNDTL